MSTILASLTLSSLVEAFPQVTLTINLGPPMTGCNAVSHGQTTVK